ncbi:somatostatin receptor type 2-like [Nematostella vectensis]|uniref:somatostatin receptor type 2-like n=1 Tax=Nematostella vectensis TaxID=45351 RepID=UPI002076E56D|nr:somatostatin receptor type 2-like [Nematostella vectensis]
MDLFLVVLIALQFFVSIVGIIGNVSVIRVVWSTRSMHTTTNYLLANLALADIITLSTSPYLYKFVFGSLHFGYNGWSNLTNEWICRVCVSVALLTVVAVERYHAMVKPLSHRFRLGREQVWKVVLVIWFVSILLNIPIFIVVRFDPQLNVCISAFDLNTGKEIATYLAFYLGINICIPGLIITACYLSILKGLLITNSICSETVETIQGREEKKKLAKLLASVTGVYFICFAPFAIFMIYLSAKKFLNSQDKNSSPLFNYTYFVLTSLIFSNSCLNPVLYAFQSSSYRRGFAKLYTCNCLKARRQIVQVESFSMATDARLRTQQQSTHNL